MSSSDERQRATVVARWSESRLLLETAEGNSVSLDVEGEMEDRVDVGVELCIELGHDGTVASWSLAEDDES